MQFFDDFIGKSIANEGSRLIPQKRSIKTSNCKQLTEWLEEKGKEAQEHFEKSRRRSIIQLNEFGAFNNASEKDINKFIDFIKNCSDKYHLTLFLTTNDPLNIDKRILSLTENIPMGPASKDDVINILEYYLKTKNIPNLDYDKVAEEIIKDNPQKYYSNGQIENIALYLPNGKEVSQDDLIAIIRKVPPLINDQIMNKFIKEQELLNPENA